MPASGETSSSVLRRLRRGGVWVFAGRAAGMFVVFATFVVLAKALSPADFAAFVLASSVVSFAGVAAGLGAPTLICRYLAESLGVQDTSRSSQALKLTYGIGFGASVVVGLLVWQTADYWAVHIFNVPQLAAAAPLLAAWIVLLATSLLVAETFRGLHQIHFASIFGGASGGLIANGLVLTALLLASRWWTLDFKNVAALFVVAFIPTLLLAFWLLQRAWKTLQNESTRIALQPSTKQPLRLSVVLVEALPLCLLQLVSLGMDQYDIWLVGAWMSDDNVAIYGASRRLAFLGMIPLAQVGWAIASTIAELNSQGEIRQLQQVLRGSATFAFFASAAAVVPMILFARPLMGHMFGAHYADGANILIILCISQLASSALGPSYQALLMTGNQRLALVCFLLSMPLLIFAPWAANHYGMLGFAAVAATIPFVGNTFTWLALRYQLGIWSHASFAPAYLSGLLAMLMGRDGIQTPGPGKILYAAADANSAVK